MDGDPPADRREVRDTYERIGEHFARTREHPWPDVREFVADAPRVRTALDLGCANGRHADLLADRADRVVGVDVSRTLLRTARERARERGYADALALVEGEASTLPVAGAAVDLAVYVATLHHLPTRSARVDSLDELARVLAPDGRALVSAWCVDHPTFDADRAVDTTVDWTLPGGERIPRYYHVYDRDSFERDLEASDCRVVETFASEGNCYGVVAPRGSPG